MQDKRAKETPENIPEQTVCIEWDRIDTVLLDMDGTLLDLNFDTVFWSQHLPEQYALQQGLSLEEANTYIKGLMSERAGKLCWYDIELWNRSLGMDLSQAKKDLQHLVKVRSNTMAFLEALLKTDKKRILATNAHPLSLEFKLSLVNLTPYFDHIYSSNTLGAAKEDQAFWVELNQRQPFDPARTLLLDDNERVLLSAREYGIVHLFGIAEPDSQSAKKTYEHFNAIQCFSQVLPPLLTDDR